MRREDAINKIARDTLRIETLQVRNSDRLDFHELSVGQIERALTEAYEAGRASNSPARASNVQIDGHTFGCAKDAVKHANATGNTAVQINGRFLVVGQDAFYRLMLAGQPFACLCPRLGKIVAVPVH